MKVNIHNYEEYFFLYFDNELSVQDRKEVELFINKNPAYHDEFMQIKASVLIPSSEGLTDKSFLLKGVSEINIKKYEEVLNLYIDNELTESERAETEKLLSGNDQLNFELQRIKKAKAFPDLSIIFPYKGLLYKSGSESVTFIWARVSIAAITLGFGIWVGGKYLLSGTVQEPIHNSVVRIPLKTKSLNADLGDKGPGMTTKSENQLAIKQTSFHKHDVYKERVSPELHLKAKERTGQIVQMDPGTQNKKPSNELPERDLKFNQITITDQLAVRETDNFSNKKETNEDHKLNGTEQIAFKDIIAPVSYFEQDFNNDDADRNIAGQQFHKSKLGMFIKKASRTIARNLKINRSDDQN